MLENVFSRDWYDEPVTGDLRCSVNNAFWNFRIGSRVLGAILTISKKKAAQIARTEAFTGSGTVKSNQIKSNHLKSNQIKSNQIKSNQDHLKATL